MLFRLAHRPEKLALQDQIEKVLHQLERLREPYVLGDFARDTYMAARAGKVAELEQELGGADYPLEAALTRFNRMGEILCDATHKQQKRAINLLVDKIPVRTATRPIGVALQN